MCRLWWWVACGMSTKNWNGMHHHTHITTRFFFYTKCIIKNFRNLFHLQVKDLYEERPCLYVTEMNLYINFKFSRIYLSSLLYLIHSSLHNLWILKFIVWHQTSKKYIFFINKKKKFKRNLGWVKHIISKC